MAGRGPAPRGQRSRERDNPELRTVAQDGHKRGPGLPEGLEWPSATVRWWDTWRSSAQASTFTATDWDFLLDTALLHAEMWSGNASVAAELRLRVAKFGATPEDRARLRLEVAEPAPSASEPAKGGPPRRSSADRRSRVLKVIDGAAG